MDEQGKMTQMSTCHKKLLGALVSTNHYKLEAALIYLKLCTTEPGPHLSYRNEAAEASLSQVPDPCSSTFPVGKKEFLHSREDVPVFSGKREHSGIEHRNVRHPWGPLPAATSRLTAHAVGPLSMALYCTQNFRHKKTENVGVHETCSRCWRCTSVSQMLGHRTAFQDQCW